MIPEFTPNVVDPTVTADITHPGRQAGGVLTISLSEYRDLESALRPVPETIAKTAATLARDRPLAQVAHELGVSKEIRCLLPDRFSAHSFDLLRLDFILSAGTPVVLEANYGAAVGGSIDAQAHALAAKHSAPEPNTARIRWAAHQARQLGQTELFLPLWPWTHIRDADSYFAASKTEAESERVDLRLIAFDAFAQLRQQDPRPRVALRLFATLDAVRRAVDLDALGYFAGSEVTWLQDEAVAIPSNKALMASTVFRELLSPSAAVVPDSALVAERPIPGYVTRSIETVLSQRSVTVLKPTSDHGGTGVVVGPGTSDVSWAAAARRQRDDLTVAQRFYLTDEVEFVNRYQDGATEHFSGPVSYGAYFVRGNMVGVLARVGTQQMRNAPVNGNTGAVLTALVPRDGQ